LAHHLHHINAIKYHSVNMMLQSLQPTPQVSIKSIHTPAPRAPPSSKPISTKSFYRPKRLGGGGASSPTMADDGDGGSEGKK
jgi:hypothetical protein